MRGIDWRLVVAISLGLLVTVVFAMAYKPTSATPCSKMRRVGTRTVIVGKMIMSQPVYECELSARKDTT